ncbi:hypothetical protein MBH78_12225 [Oceanimonas sp. NS1]|nr:hypothetical protein [Oceanimonas sp. NS1]
MELSGTTAGEFSFQLQGENSTAVDIAANIDDYTDLSALADAINAKASETGIKASMADNKLTLVSESGEDIKITGYTSTATTGTMSLTGHQYGGADGETVATTAVDLVTGTDTDAVVSGSIRLNSAESFSVAADAAQTEFGLTTADTPEFSSLQTVSELDFSTQAGAQAAISVLDGAIGMIDAQRSDLGAMQNRLNSTINNLANTRENAAAGMSRIKDVDFAQETVNLTKQQILQQAGTSILAQAKQIPQAALSLLG